MKILNSIGVVIMEDNLETKSCPTCGGEYPLSLEYWYRDKKAKSGCSTYCKTCTKARASKNYYDNIEAKLEYHKQYYLDNKEKISEYKKQYWQTEQGRKGNAKSQQNRRARKAQLPNTLTIEEYEDNLKHFNHSCAYCECELTPDNHHMEHVYPISRGVYGTTKENCIPSCNSCNSSKHAKTLAEWYVWTEDYSFERLLKIHEITSGGKDWIIN